MRTRRLPALVVALTLVAGCGGGDDGGKDRAGGDGGGGRAAAPEAPAVPACTTGTVAGRGYELCTPGGQAVAEARGLVVALHGRGASAAEMRAMTGLERPAADAGLAVVYPDGIDGGWGDDSFPTPARPRGDEDVAFLDALVDELGTGGPVGLVGFSNGASMALRYAAQRPDRVRAVVAVAGQLPRDPAVRPMGRVPLLAVYGSADPVRSYASGIAEPASRAPGQPTPTLPTPDTVAAFAGAATHAGPDPSDPDATDGTTVLTERWRDGEGTVAVLLTVVGGGHTWPSSPELPPPDFGAPSRDLDASAEAIRFVLDGDAGP
jgi:polyhydroxybutyrate depolymerase